MSRSPKDNEKFGITEPIQPLISNGINPVETLVALRGVVSKEASQYVTVLVERTHQDKGIILECGILAFQALPPEQKQAIIGEVLKNRMTF